MTPDEPDNAADTFAELLAEFNAAAEAEEAHANATAEWAATQAYLLEALVCAGMSEGAAVMFLGVRDAIADSLA